MPKRYRRLDTPSEYLNGTILSGNRSGWQLDAGFRFWRIIPCAYHHRTSRSHCANKIQPARWAQILDDPNLAKLPDRIETDRHGHMLMSAPPGFRHSECQGQIIALLIQFAPQGQMLPECPISTADGVKAIDVGWLDASRDEIGQDIPLLTGAPEICIELLSPSNLAAEIAEKRLLYFDAGAAGPSSGLTVRAIATVPGVPRKR
jgi:Putative restriction endonuclease